MQENTDAEIQCSDSEKRLSKQESQQVPQTSEILSQNVGLYLFDMMKTVTKDDVNPTTVNAACKCAEEIHKIMRLNFDIKKLGL